MARREQQEVRREPETGPGRGGTRETHPAFGVAVVTRGSGTPRSLFQSDLRHNETISLSIHEAERLRDLSHDWVHPGRQLVEIEMSLAQWGSLVSSIGIGSGVPVTLRRTEAEPFVPEIPYEPRIAVSLAETRGSVDRLIESIREAFDELDEAIEGKKGVRAVREAKRALAAAIANAPANAEFSVKSLARAAETLTSQAKSDIEAHVLSAARLTGLQAPLLVPELEADGGGRAAIESADPEPLPPISEERYLDGASDAECAAYEDWQREHDEWRERRDHG